MEGNEPDQANDRSKSAGGSRIDHTEGRARVDMNDDDEMTMETSTKSHPSRFPAPTLTSAAPPSLSLPPSIFICRFLSFANSCFLLLF